MRFDQFKNYVLNTVNSKYKGRYRAKLVDLPKNNGGVEVYLCVSKTCVEDGMAFKLEPYYNNMDSEMDISDTIEDICYIIEENEMGLDQVEGIQDDFEAVKDKIVYRLMNKKANSEWLKTVPHRDFFDMAIDYYILLSNDKYGQMSIHIKNEQMEKWGISEKDLYELAVVNTPKLLPCELTPMDETLRKMVDKYQDKEEFLRDMIKFEEAQKEFPLYELSQCKSINGATAFIYTGVLKRIADIMECDLVIIPASVYEVLISPYKEEMDAANLKRLLEYSNEVVIPFEEVLSNSVFRYSREADYLDYMWPDNPS